MVRLAPREEDGRPGDLLPFNLHDDVSGSLKAGQGSVLKLVSRPAIRAGRLFPHFLHGGLKVPAGELRYLGNVGSVVAGGLGRHVSRGLAWPDLAPEGFARIGQLVAGEDPGTVVVEDASDRSRGSVSGQPLEDERVIRLEVLAEAGQLFGFLELGQAVADPCLEDVSGGAVGCISAIAERSCFSLQFGA